jgi:hypothetical protein
MNGLAKRRMVTSVLTILKRYIVKICYMQQNHLVMWVLEMKVPGQWGEADCKTEPK